MNMTSINPSNGAVLWEGNATDAQGVAHTVSSANTAFQSWSLTTLEERIAVLERYAEVLKRRRDEIAVLIAQENGKVMREANAEAGALIGKIAISIEAYHDRTGRQMAEMDGGIRRELAHRPLGVMAVFGPYNFPMHLANGHMVPALLAGNTVVLKPSEDTPACGELLAACMQEAGFPEGVVNLVQGGRDTGVALASNRDIAGILFTGSYATGRAIHQSLAGRPEIMLALEMGGNNPLIVHEVNDAEAAASLVVDSAFATTGQRCTCARRLIVPSGEQGNQLIERFVEVSRTIQVGAPDETPEPYMGPMINNMQADAVLQAQSRLAGAGGRVLLESKRLHESLPFLSVGIVDVTGADIDDEEIFGPLLQVIRVKDIEEAVRVANDTKYGLSAGVITDNPAHWEYAYPRLRAGIINVNRPLTGAASASPFGGPGCSGNFRPGAYYAADYCAYPVATLAMDQVKGIALAGVN